jgi:hypothetical protein
VIRLDPRMIGPAVVVWAAATVGGYGVGTLLAPVAFDPIMAGASATASVFVAANLALFTIYRTVDDPPDPPGGKGVGVAPHP